MECIYSPKKKTGPVRRRPLMTAGGSTGAGPGPAAAAQMPPRDGSPASASPSTGRAAPTASPAAASASPSRVVTLAAVAAATAAGGGGGYAGSSRLGGGRERSGDGLRDGLMVGGSVAGGGRAGSGVPVVAPSGAGSALQRGIAAAFREVRVCVCGVWCGGRWYLDCLRVGCNAFYTFFCL